MRLQMTVELRDRQWHAVFSDAPDRESVAASPKDAIWRLFEASPGRQIDPRSITADAPDSESRLHFSVEGR
jgi:hypothetical protein